MPSLSAVRAFNATKTFSYHPVAVFVGGTSGIGQGMAEAFARHTGGRSSIYIVGRNEAAARSILDSLPKPTSASTPESQSPPDDTTVYKREFVQCDARLMKNVHAAAKLILSKEPKINYLVLSTGVLSMQGYTPTEEGIDQKLAVHYYARWRFAYDLMSGVEKAKEAGEDGAVVSVLAAGRGGAIDVDDLGLEKGFSITKAALVTPTYNDLMMESFADRHPRVTFVHTHPWMVRSSLGAKSDSMLMRLFSPAINVLFYFLSNSIQDAGEYMWHGVYNSKEGVNNRVGSKGEDLGMARYFGSVEERRKLWDHTVEKTKV